MRNEWFFDIVLGKYFYIYAEFFFTESVVNWPYKHFFFSQKVFDVLERKDREFVVSALFQWKACKFNIPILFQKGLCTDDTDIVPERLEDQRY